MGTSEEIFKTEVKNGFLAVYFEAYAPTGGALLSQAATMPSKGYKGGVGAYRFEKDYDNTPDYKFMRQAIQINQQVFNEWKAKQNEAENKPQE